MYETKALNSLDKVVNKAEERHREKQAVLSNNGNEGSGSSNDAVVKPKDPLDFWVVQVCSLLRFTFKNVDFLSFWKKAKNSTLV